jgi:hypothetical protein
LSLALIGCVGPGASTWEVAVGGSGALPTWKGGCDVDAAEGDGITIADGRWHAERPGRLRVPCERGALVLIARAVADLTITGAERLSGKGHYRLEAVDAKGKPLTLGDSSQVTWTLHGGLADGSRCSHMTGTCLEPWQHNVVATSAGEATVSASFNGRSASFKVVVEPRR